MPSELNAFFRPQAIAVIGASRNPRKLGYILLDNLLKDRYPGHVFPVNPGAEPVLGLTAYRSVLDIPGEVELAVVVVPAVAVAAVLDQCGRKGVRAAVIITAGFREAGPHGVEREREVSEVARRYGIRLIGPNSVGIIDTFGRLNASFAEGLAPSWEIGVLSHSGAVAVAILDWATSTRVGFSKFVSLGNMADVTEVDLLRAWRDDDEVRVAVGYFEGIRDGRGFMEAARAFTARKPLIAMKVGTTASGRAAALSHTGALAGSDRVVDAALRQVGAVRALTMEELFDFTRCFAFARLPAGPNIAIVTNSGGPGVMAADTADRLGLALPKLSEATLEALRERLPASASLRNPIDLIGDADSERYDHALTSVVADPAVDTLIVMLTPTAVAEPEVTARLIVALTKSQEKPVMAVFMGGTGVDRARAILAAEHVPVYNYPERAVRSVEAMVRYAEYRRSL